MTTTWRRSSTTSSQAGRRRPAGHQHRHRAARVGAPAGPGRRPGRGGAAGAEVVTGGSNGGNGTGYFYAPTVVTGAPAETLDLLREETGLVAPLVRVKSLDEAIELANGTRFGLGANVYTKDLDTIFRRMRELRRAPSGSTTP